MRAFFRTGLALWTTLFTAPFAVAMLAFWLEGSEDWRGTAGFCAVPLTKLEGWLDVSGDFGTALGRRGSVLDMLRVMD